MALTFHLLIISFILFRDRPSPFTFTFIWLYVKYWKLMSVLRILVNNDNDNRVILVWKYKLFVSSCFMAPVISFTFLVFLFSVALVEHNNVALMTILLLFNHVIVYSLVIGLRMPLFSMGKINCLCVVTCYSMNSPNMEHYATDNVS